MKIRATWRERTSAHLLVRVAARRALVLLDVEGALTASHTQGVGLVVPRALRGGTFRLHRGKKREG